MNKTIIISGASDDLIEIDGDFKEEYYYNENGNYLIFSDGSVIEVNYTNGGIWRLERIIEGSAEFKRKKAVSADSDEYSDIVTLIGQISWVIKGSQFNKIK